MTHRTQHWFACDRDGCDTELGIYAPEKKQAMETARNCGWSASSYTEHYCTKHTNGAGVSKIHQTKVSNEVIAGNNNE